MKTTLRIGITVWDGFINPCVRNATNFDDVHEVCGSLRGGGAIIPPLSLLINLMSQKYNFTFVPIQSEGKSFDILARSFAKNETDLALELWAPTTQRAGIISMSQPLIYRQRGFVVSRRTMLQHYGEIRIFPFDRSCLFAISVAIISYIVLDTVARILLSSQTESVTLLSCSRRLGDSIWDFSDLSGLCNKAITKRIIRAPAAAAYIIAWSVVFRSAIGGFITASVTYKKEPPFRTLEMLAQRAATGKAGIVFLANDSLYDSINASTAYVSIISKMLIVHSVEEAMNTVRGSSYWVYASGSLSAPLQIGKQCDEFRFIEVNDIMARGSAMPFRGRTTLPQEFSAAITLTQNAIQRSVERAAMEATCPGHRDDDSAYSVSLHLNHMWSTFMCYGTVCFTACALLFGEVIAEHSIYK